MEMTYDKAIELILKAYPDKGEDWARSQLTRAVRNIEGDLPDSGAYIAILEAEFGIKAEK